MCWRGRVLGRDLGAIRIAVAFLPVRLGAEEQRPTFLTVAIQPASVFEHQEASGSPEHPLTIYQKKGRTTTASS